MLIKKWVHLLIAVFFVIALYFIDLKTNPKIIFSAFYIIPIAYSAWFIGFKAGLFIVILSTSLRFLVELSHITTPSNYYAPYLNLSFRIAIFSALAYLSDFLRDLINKERNISRLNTEMVSAISHEFNNLLTGIHLSSMMLREDEGENISEERQKFYNILDQNYVTMMQNVRVFLNKARLEAGKLKLNILNADIASLLKSTLQILTPLIQEKGLTVIKSFPDKPLIVKCDPDAINLVLSNLLSNAIKYSQKDGTLIISVLQKDSTAEISIKDTGIGIPKEDLDKVFSGFYRTKEAQKKSKGFGVGLKVSKEILELHSSELKAESELGKGSIFYFSLPLS